LIGPDKSFCASPTSILFDDNPLNCSRFCDAGGRGCLVPAPSNYKYELDPWEEIAALISNLQSTGVIVI